MHYELNQLLVEKIPDPKLDLVTYGKLIIDTIVHKQGESDKTVSSYPSSSGAQSRAATRWTQQTT